MKTRMFFYLVALFVVVLLPIVSSAQPLFSNPVNYPVGDGPRSVFAADLDGDADLDLAVGNHWNDNISILFNNGDGTFQSPVNYPVGDGPQFISAADLDGNSTADLAVANGASDDVSILLNDGNGNLELDGVYSVGDGPASVFAADLDGDTDLDLGVGNHQSGDFVSILFNNGDGTFQDAVNCPSGASPHSVFAADLDGDTDLDLAVTNYASGNVSILLNDGNGNFTRDSFYSVGLGNQSIFAADLDGDTDVDLATANHETHNVSILCNHGNGTFQDAVNYPVGHYPRSVFATDLDGDTDVDLAVANRVSNNVSILFNHGDGTFQDAVNYPVGDDPRSVFAADLDGDTDVDLAVANYASDNVSILFNLMEPVPFSVAIDIKPQSCPNPLNIKGGYSKENPQFHHEDIPRRKSVLPVAILGTNDFDVTTVDFSTVLLEGVAPIRGAIEDVSTPFDGELCGCTTEGADGFDDLTLKFYRQEIVAALGDVQDGDEVVLTLTGALNDGTPIEGADCVVIISSKGDATVKPIVSVCSSYGLSQNYPNPFNPTTEIRYALPENAQVKLVVYNVAGQEIKTLVNEGQEAGYHQCVWGGKNVAGGIYFYRLQAGDFVQTRKMVLLR